MTNSSPSTPNHPRSNVARTMLLAAGILFVAGALLYNPWTVAAAVHFVRDTLHRPWTTLPDPDMVKRVEMVYLAIGALLVGVAMLVGSFRRLERAFRHPAVAVVVLALLAFFVPIAALEVGLRPFAQEGGKDTSLFVKDRDLEWKLRPSATQVWGDVTVTTNARGFRGPDVAFEKPAGTRRILYLGDSVTFGYNVARWQDTFPFVADSLLEQRSGWTVETINAGVGGYSPWQELIVLREQGLRYRPDAVVVNFVLNDVTEKFTLVRFGGLEESRQLRQSYHSPLDPILSRSVLVTKVRKFARKWKAKRVLGSNPELAAIRRENFDVGALIHTPDKQHIQEAWKITLTNLQAIFDVCRENDIPVLLVIHPFRVQFDAPEELNAPQRRLAAYARAHRVRTVDLLPIVHDHLDAANQFPASLYLDHDHLSVSGHRLVAGVVADSLQAVLDAPLR